jgi:hypothetical protein
MRNVARKCRTASDSERMQAFKAALRSYRLVLKGRLAGARAFTSKLNSPSKTEAYGSEGLAHSRHLSSLTPTNSSHAIITAEVTSVSSTTGRKAREASGG